MLQGNRTERDAWTSGGELGDRVTYWVGSEARRNTVIGPSGTLNQCRVKGNRKGLPLQIKYSISIY